MFCIMLPHLQSGTIFPLIFVCVALEFELSAYTLSHSISPFFVMKIFKIGSHNLPGLALNHNPPDLCLLSS
jgi:hypothetical protein